MHFKVFHVCIYVIHIRNTYIVPQSATTVNYLYEITGFSSS